MTKKDYVTIAACFAREREDAMRDGEPDPAETKGCWFGLRNRIALEMAMDNPRFDRDRFLAACEK